jgi:DNA primase
MPRVWVSRRILLVEGGFDLFPLQRYFPEITASLTAHVSQSLVRVLQRVGVTDLWLGYDNDKTGQESAERVRKQYGKSFKLHFLRFPKIRTVYGGETKDPSDLWELFGEHEFGNRIQQIIEKAGSSLESL